jgi:tRNA pseudouridine13 synthase
LEKRVESGLYYRILKGDIAKKYSTGGMFIVEDLDIDQPRYAAKEISFTAPIFGPKMWKTYGASAELEEEVWADSKISLEQLKLLKVRGTRRLGRIIPHIEVNKSQDGLTVNMFLSKGVFATSVLREIMKD